MNRKKEERKNPKKSTPKLKTTKEKTTQSEKVGCKNCHQLYEKLKEEKFQRILTHEKAEFWEGL